MLVCINIIIYKLKEMDLTIYTDTTGKVPGSDQIIGNIESGTIVDR